MSRVRGTKDRHRLVVQRSNRNIFAQVVDDYSGITLTGASSLSEPVKKGSFKAPAERSRAVGKLLAERALKKKVGKVVFDRKHYKYHGNVKELADGAREGGLEF